MTYAEWIADYSRRQNGALLGKCRSAVTQMRKAFPELAEVRGHVFCMWGRRGHFWAVDPTGAIVDPTLAQFPGPVTYEPWIPGSEVRVGKCMNCGDEIWESVPDLEHVEAKSICGRACEMELEAMYNRPNPMGREI